MIVEATMSETLNQPTGDKPSILRRFRNYLRRVLWGLPGDSSISDVRDLAMDWARMVSYDFQALGLDTDRPIQLVQNADTTSLSMWQLGRRIVEGVRLPDLSKPPIQFLFDAIMLERVVLHFLPAELLKYRADSIKRRFQLTVGKELFDIYFPPMAPERAVTTEELRAELDFMMSETMQIYLVTPLRPQSRGRLLWFCLRPFMVISVFMLIASACITIHDSELDQFATLPLIPVFGAMGAMLSLQQRIENLPNKGDTVRNVLAMESGRETTWITSIAGAIFAVILNLIFAAGMIEGNLFPNFNYLDGQGIISPGSGPLSDISKMLIWAFVAGFAERIVPDTITRLTKVLQTNEFGAERRTSISRLEGDEASGKPGIGNSALFPEMTVQMSESDHEDDQETEKERSGEQIQTSTNRGEGPSANVSRPIDIKPIEVPKTGSTPGIQPPPPSKPN